MNPADLARNLAISLEAKKDALSQRQSGDWKVSFTVQGIDMDARLTQAPMGTRYAMVLVEIGDDEQPVERKEASPAPRQSAKPRQADGDKRNWRDMPPAQRAGILINDAVFASYLRERHPDEWHETGEADACLKFICKIDSKRDLAVNARAEQMFNHLTADYRAWQAAERVGA